MTPYLIADQVVLIDGPMAGHLWDIPANCTAYEICGPQPLRLGHLDADVMGDLSDTTVYRIREVAYNAEIPIRVRVGWSSGIQPAEHDLMEHVPSGLAEQGLLDWEQVQSTRRDRDHPVPIEECGDPLKACDPRLPSPSALSVDIGIDASCACGWRTERIALDRRSQLVRTARQHVFGEAARRERFRQPIAVVFEGTGALDDCFGAVAVDESNQRAFGRCRRCRWETERVELFRFGPLQDLCRAHTGPDGVRRVRNQLLTALGLPPADR